VFLSFKKRITLIYAAVLGGCLLFSLALFLFIGNTSVPKVFFFPDSRQNTLAGEMRFIPRRRSREELIQKYLQELILGPERIDYFRTLPKETELQSVLLRENHLYIDFNEAILFQDSDTPLNFDETREMIKSALFYNFHFLREVTITANGQVPIKKNKSR
jgi:hypothetical protein